MSLTTSAGVISVSGMVAGVGGVAVGLAVSRVGRKKTVLWLSGILAAISSILMLHVTSLGYVMALGVINGIAWTLFPVLITIPFELKNIRPREIAVIMGLLTTAMWVGGAMGPIMAGFIQESSRGLEASPHCHKPLRAGHDCHRPAVASKIRRPVAFHTGMVSVPETWQPELSNRRV